MAVLLVPNIPLLGFDVAVFVELPKRPEPTELAVVLVPVDVPPKPEPNG